MCDRLLWPNECGYDFIIQEDAGKIQQADPCGRRAPGWEKGALYDKIEAVDSRIIKKKGRWEG